MLQSKHVNLGQRSCGQMQKQANSDRAVITIGGMITPIMLANGREEAGEQPREGPILMDLGSLVNMLFIKEVTPPFLFKMIGDKPFPLPNEPLVYTTEFGCRDNWKIYTPAHRQAIVEAERTHGVYPLELEVFEGGHRIIQRCSKL